MEIKRLPKERWAFPWEESDLKKIDNRSSFFRKAGAIDDYSAWKMAEKEHYHNTKNRVGFMMK